jgi:2-haloacid dehalogenase
MIAAHGWDLAGASHAGLATCFIAREGQSLYTYPAPDFEATDILAMAEQLVAYSGKQSVDIQINADKIAKEDSKK